MKKFIDLPLEVLRRLMDDKYVEGSLHKCKNTGKIVFRAYNRQNHKTADRIILQLEDGWLKESKTRYKFYNSTKKELGFRRVSLAMYRALKDAMEKLETEDLINRV